MDYQLIEDGTNQWYSVYHEPNSLTDLNVGVVLCNPLGQEAIRCHKLYVLLANKLADLGYHVLRFDYLGTGDSSGDFQSFSMDEGVRGIGLMIDELRHTFDVSHIILIGVRMGATLAMKYAMANQITGLVLVHPVFEGKQYLQNINEDYEHWLGGSFTKEKGVPKSSMPSFGFNYSGGLQDEITQITYRERDLSRAPQTLLIADHCPDSVASYLNVSFEKSVNKGFWVKKGGEADKSMVPSYELNKILDWLEQRS